MSHHAEPIPDFVWGEASFAFTTLLMYPWPCVNSGNSNSSDSLKKHGIDVNLFLYSYIQLNIHGTRCSSFGNKYSLKKAPCAIVCNSLSISICNDYTKNSKDSPEDFLFITTLSLRLYKLIQN